MKAKQQSDLVNTLRDIIADSRRDIKNILEQITLLEVFSGLDFKQEETFILAVSFCFEFDRSELLQEKFIGLLHQNQNLLKKLPLFNLFYFGAHRCYRVLKEAKLPIDFKTSLPVDTANFILSIPFFILTYRGHSTFLVDYFQNEQPDIFEVFQSGHELTTVFDVAVQAEDEKVLKFLLFKFQQNSIGKDIFLHRALNTLCLLAVVKNQQQFTENQVSKVQLLKKYGANPFVIFEAIENNKNIMDGTFIYYQVAARGIVWLAKFLRQHFPNEPIDQTSHSEAEKGYTSLQVATIKSNLPMVSFLLSQGADPLLEMQEGGCAIDIAILKNDAASHSILDKFLLNRTIEKEKLRRCLAFSIEQKNLYAIGKFLPLLIFDDLFEMTSKDSFFPFIVRAIKTENKEIIKKVISDRGLLNSIFLNKAEDQKHNMLSLAMALEKKKSFDILLDEGASIYDVSVGADDFDLQRIQSIDSSLTLKAAQVAMHQSPYFFSKIIERHYYYSKHHILSFMVQHRLESQLTALILLNIPFLITLISKNPGTLGPNYVEPQGEYKGMSALALAVLLGEKRRIKELNAAPLIDWYQEIILAKGERKTILQLFKESEFFRRDSFFYQVILLRYSKDKTELRKLRQRENKEEEKYPKYQNENKNDFASLFIASMNNHEVVENSPYLTFIEQLIINLEKAFNIYKRAQLNNNDNFKERVLLHYHDIAIYLFRLFQAVFLYSMNANKHSIFPKKIFQDLRNANMHGSHFVAKDKIIELAELCIKNKKVFLSRIKKKPKKSIVLTATHQSPTNNSSDFYFLQNWLEENSKELNQSKSCSTEERLQLIEKYMIELTTTNQQFKKCPEPFYEAVFKNICIRIGECFQKIEEHEPGFYECITQEIVDFKIIAFFHVVVREELGHKFPELEPQTKKIKEELDTDTIWGTDFYNLFLAYYINFDWQAFARSLQSKYKEMAPGNKP